MVLESMLNPKNAENKPLHVFLISFVYSLIAVMFANQLFPAQASIFAISLITIIFIPFFQKLFEIEVRVKNKTYGMGVGKSKKDAEQQAAREALVKMKVTL